MLPACQCFLLHTDQVASLFNHIVTLPPKISCTIPLTSKGVGPSFPLPLKFSSHLLAPLHHTELINAFFIEPHPSRGGSAHVVVIEASVYGSWYTASFLQLHLFLRTAAMHKPINKKEVQANNATAFCIDNFIWSSKLHKASTHTENQQQWWKKAVFFITEECEENCLHSRKFPCENHR